MARQGYAQLPNMTIKKVTTMKVFTLSIALATVTTFAIASPPLGADIPSNWQEFKSSAHPEDKRNVADIEKKAGGNLRSLCAEARSGARAKNETRRYAAIRDYLVDQRIINGQDLGNLGSGHVEIGMTLCGVLASLGAPTRNHSRRSAASQTEQLVYERTGYMTRYISLDWRQNNFYVSAISD